MTVQERRIRVGDLLAARLRELADACSAAARGDKAAARILSDATDKYWFGLVVGPGQIETLYDDPYDDCDDDVIAGQIAEDESEDSSAITEDKYPTCGPRSC